MLALIAVLPLLLSVTAGPISKRYSHSLIVSGRDGKCLIAAPKTGSGSAVFSGDCVNTEGAKYWDINPGSGSVILSGTNLALDAGSSPGNFGSLKVWDSYPGLYQQTWYLTDDNRIAITGGDQCLDEGDNGVQTYQCTTGNTNQVWNVKTDGGPTSSSSQAPSSTSSSSSASSTPTGQGYYIHPNGDTKLCVTVQDGYDAIGTNVAISACFGGGPWDKLQRWNIPAQGASGHVQSLGDRKLCLDAGDNPADGSGVKTWTCYDGLQQQEWTWSGSKLSLGNNQCLDVKADSQPVSYKKPYGSEKDLQTWQCFDGNANQEYTLSQ